MTIAELLQEIESKFPKFPLSAWADTYRDVLAPHQGDKLRAAWVATLRGWSDFVAPKPAHIAANLPEGHRPKSFVERMAEADLVRLKKTAERADALYATACRESAEFLAHPWSDHAKFHLRNVTRRIAEREAHGIGNVLTAINGAESRIACSRCRATRKWADDEPRVCPKRAPDAWLDEHDAAIFKAQHESQERVNPEAKGGMRGDKEPPWNLKQPDEGQVVNPVAAHIVKRRDEINSRIPKP